MFFVIICEWWYVVYLSLVASLWCLFDMCVVTLMFWVLWLGIVYLLCPSDLVHIVSLVIGAGVLLSLFVHPVVELSTVLLAVFHVCVSARFGVQDVPAYSTTDLIYCLYTIDVVQILILIVI